MDNHRRSGIVNTALTEILRKPNSERFAKGKPIADRRNFQLKGSEIRTLNYC
jgi:hypothetical protein